MKQIFEYQYKELEKRALANNVKKEDLENLAKWFNLYDTYSHYWNGESWKINENYSLKPNYDNNEKVSYEII